MKAISRLRSWWRAWRDRAAFERRMSAEMRFHLESRADDLVRRGVDREAARRQARIEFGNPAAYQDECRRSRRLTLLDDFAADVRFALRGLRQQTLLSAIVIATLTLGIGVSSGVFTLCASIALRPRIDAGAETFLRVYSTSSTDPARRLPFSHLSVEEYYAFRDGLTSVRALSGQSRFSAPLGARDAADTSVNFVTCNFYDVYGPVRAERGRLLQPADCDQAAPVIVLSDAIWRTRFDTDERIVGRPLLLKGIPVTVIGIAPPIAGAVGISYASVPFTLRGVLALGGDPRRLSDGHFAHDRWLDVTGRLMAGATRDQVAAEASVVAARLDARHPGQKTAVAVTDGAMVHDPVSRSMVLSFVGLVMGALTCLVLIACANVATLLLSRADARQQEVAVRLSLGAGRGRLVRMLLTETLVLAACAGAGSLYLAYTLPGALMTWLLGVSPELPLGPDWRVFLYLTASVGFAGVAAGLAPAIESMRADVLAALRGRRSTLGAGSSGSGFRAGLVAVQVAFSFVLLVGAALFLVTHYYTVRRSVGFQTTHVLQPRVIEQAAGARTTAPAPAALRDTLQGVPGVQSIVFAATSPVGVAPSMDVSGRGEGWHAAAVNDVSPGYFESLDIPILLGRGLDERDRPCGRDRCQVVVSEAFVRQVLGAAAPLGTTLLARSGGTLEIVGVARDTTVQVFNVPDPPQIYVPWTPDGRPYQPLVRFTGAVGSVAPAVTAALNSAFPGAVLNVRTLQSSVEAWMDDAGKIEALIVALGGTAVALAAVGVFGIVSFAVSRRRQELGIRLALGATRADIYATVVGGAVKPVLAGLACGVGLALLAAAGFARVLVQMHFAVSARDPVLYACAGASLSAIVGIALLLPARRAAAINPLVALKCE